MTTVPKGWKIYLLGQLAQYINGKAFRPADWKSTGRPIIRIQNLTDASKPFNYCDGPVESRYLVGDGDLLVSWSATLGSFLWDRGPGVLNQHIFKVIPNLELIEKEFLHFLMLNTLETMAEHTHGIAMKHITKGKFEALKAAVPPLAEQRRILARLKGCVDRIDEAVTLASALYLEQSYLSASVIESVLHPSLAAEAGWINLTLAELVSDTRNGRSIAQDVDGKANGHVLTLTAVRGVTLSTEFNKPIELPPDVAKQFSIEAGDVFVSRANTMELVGLASVAEGKPKKRLIYPDLLIKLKVDRAKVLPRYLAYALRSAGARKQIKARALGASRTMVKISGERLREVAIPVPSIKDQAEIVAKLDATYELISRLGAETASLNVAAVRGAVLRRAFAGEL
jgi:type I restriction enzyme S subunit